ncbi:hypothetical protein PG985_003644 [Apiospora marii]|uniref:Uncharacterized protein n=1 Tax=Apiospora marii TaxID=335849 RepID=A0ABR1SHJ4_9PEZI
MHDSGWGFDAYRTSFGDDELFQRYIDYVRNAMVRGCKDEGVDRMASTATLYPREEQGGQHLKDLSLDEVRKLHMEWVAAVKRDVPDGYDDGLGLRRDYFMLVNDEVLERFRAAEEKLAKENREPEYFHEGVMAIVCVGYEQEQDEEDDDDDNELEGRMWQYVWADSLSELYIMINNDSREWWFTAFAWPPEVYGTYA